MHKVRHGLELFYSNKQSMTTDGISWTGGPGQRDGEIDQDNKQDDGYGDEVDDNVLTVQILESDESGLLHEACQGCGHGHDEDCSTVAYVPWLHLSLDSFCSRLERVNPDQPLQKHRNNDNVVHIVVYVIVTY